jgi:glutamate--cysteine ligase catalytic subunit
MRLRRKRLLTVLQPDEISPTVTIFPLMGVGTFTEPEAPPGVSLPAFKVATQDTANTLVKIAANCRMQVGIGSRPSLSNSRDCLLQTPR